MTLSLNSKEIDQVILSILCNGALSFANQSDLDYNYDRQQYNSLKDNHNCHEDILLELIKLGGKISFVDNQDDDSEYSKDLTYDLIKSKLSNMDNQELIENVQIIINENGDAENDYNVLQLILYDEIIFG